MIDDVILLLDQCSRALSFTEARTTLRETEQSLCLKYKSCLFLMSHKLGPTMVKVLYIICDHMQQVHKVIVACYQCCIQA